MAKFSHGDEVILVANVGDLKDICGMKAMILEVLAPQNANDYLIQVEQTKEEVRVRESEIDRIDPNDYLYQIKLGDTVVRKNGTEVKVSMIDYGNRQIEIKYPDDTYEVISIEAITGLHNEVNKVGKFEKIATELGKFTDIKNKQYGSSVDATYGMLEVLMKRYENEDDTYTIPKSLLQHILLQSRMMDKQNRIFNNPSGEGDSESPYRDLTGYSLIGVDMVESQK